MGLQAEALLMATGLLQPPDETALLASQTVLQEVQADLLQALDRLEPAPMRANPITAGYINRVAKTPDYEVWMQFLEPRIGMAEAGAYQLLHQQARLYVTNRYPGQHVSGIVGSVIAPPSETAICRWRFLVDTLENQRIGHDVASAALLPANVEAFKACLPESYAALVEALDAELNKRQAQAMGKWRPNWWLDAVIRTFKQAPPKAAPPAPKAPAPASPSKAKLDTEQLEPIPGIS